MPEVEISESAIIDELMDLDPIELTKRPEALEAIIAYHRRNRMMSEKGIKPKKDQGPTHKLDLVAMGLIVAKDPIKRRV